MSLQSLFISAYLSDRTRALERGWAAATSGRKRLWYVHQPDDPYSLLLSQVLGAVVEAADLKLRLTILPAPPESIHPDAARQRAWALDDAAWLARRFGLRFPAAPRLPDEDAIRRAQAACLKADTLDALASVSMALFSGESLPQVTEDPRAALAAGEAAVRRAGHYEGAMVRYLGEWSWGLDRLHFLTDRLGIKSPLPSPVPQPEATCGESLELFCSFRSPYSYLATDRTIALARQHGVKLRIRPVLPMVMRGLSVPLSKRLYIVRDCKRIADRLGIPFGNIADPLGEGVERCLAVSVAAEREGRAAEWLSSATRGIWSEGVDVTTDTGLLHLAERAGLSEPLVRSALADESWRAVAEDNRQALLDMGLWGVPSFRTGDVVAWGQDRLDRIDEALSVHR